MLISFLLSSHVLRHVILVHQLYSLLCAINQVLFLEIFSYLRSCFPCRWCNDSHKWFIFFCMNTFHGCLIPFFCFKDKTADIMQLNGEFMECIIEYSILFCAWKYVQGPMFLSFLYISHFYTFTEWLRQELPRGLVQSYLRIRFVYAQSVQVCNSLFTSLLFLIYHTCSRKEITKALRLSIYHSHFIFIYENDAIIDFVLAFIPSSAPKLQYSSALLQNISDVCAQMYMSDPKSLSF